MKSSFSRSVRVAAALVLALTVAGAAHGAGKEPPNDIVLTDSGRLAGVHSHDGKVISYKGIPFAAAPVGKLRWTPPEPPTP